MFVAVAAANVAAYLVPFDYSSIAEFSVATAFVVSLVGTATVFAAVPYLGVLVHLFQIEEALAGIVLAAALASVIGESTGYVLGRVGSRRALESPRAQRIIALFARRRLSAPLLFLIAAVPNPLMDVAGLVSGAMRVPYGLYFGAVFTGRLVRLGGLAWIAVSFIPR